MVLNAHPDEVHERDERERGGGRDGTGTGLHARNDADHVVDHDEHEQRAQKRHVATPGLLAQDAHADIALQVLHQILHGIGKATVRHNGGTTGEGEHNNEQNDRRDDEPERVLGHTTHQVAHYGD